MEAAVWGVNKGASRTLKAVEGSRTMEEIEGTVE